MKMKFSLNSDAQWREWQMNTPPEELIYAYLDGELSMEAKERFEVAVAADPRLKAKLEESRWFDQLLRELLPLAVKRDDEG